MQKQPSLDICYGENLENISGIIYAGIYPIYEVVSSSRITIENGLEDAPLGEAPITLLFPGGVEYTSTINLIVSDLPEKPTIPNGNSSLMKRGFYTHSYSVDAISGADSYEWEFDPDISGDINIIGNYNESTISFSLPRKHSYRRLSN